MVKQVEIMRQEGENGGGVRHRATLFASDSAEILFEFKNVDTKMWELLESKFIDRDEFEALKFCLKKLRWIKCL